MEQPVDRQLPRGDGVRDRIDQERHVVVDDPDPHPAASGLAASGFDTQRKLALAALRCDIGKELGGVPLGFAREALRLTWKGIAGQRLANRLDQRRVQARMGRH